MLLQSGGDLQLLERNFEALGFLRRQLSDEAAHAALIRRVTEGEAVALQDLRSARQALDVMKGRCLF
jgi:hypothetical protein